MGQLFTKDAQPREFRVVYFKVKGRPERSIVWPDSLRGLHRDIAHICHRPASKLVVEDLCDFRRTITTESEFSAILPKFEKGAGDISIYYFKVDVTLA